MTIEKPKAILFDWDNTLADSWPTIYKAFVKTFEHMDYEPWSFEETKRRVHKSLRDFFPELFGDRWKEAADVYLSSFKSMHIENFNKIEGADEVLKALSDRGDIFLSIVSNKTGSSLREEVEHSGWGKYFTNVIGAKDLAEDKPSILPVKKALEGSSHDVGKHVWIIGDSISDLECAYNSGCLPVFFGDQDLTHETFANHQPELHFENHADLLATIKEFDD